MATGIRIADNFYKKKKEEIVKKVDTIKKPRYES